MSRLGLLGPLALTFLFALPGCRLAGPSDPGAAERTARKELTALESTAERGTATGDDLGRLAFLRFFLDNDLDGAAEALDQVSEDEVRLPSNAYRSFMLHFAERRYPESGEIVTGLLRSAPDAWQTEVAWRRLTRSWDAHPDLLNVLGEAAEGCLDSLCTRNPDLLVQLAATRRAWLYASGAFEEGAGAMSEVGLIEGLELSHLPPAPQSMELPGPPNLLATELNWEPVRATDGSFAAVPSEAGGRPVLKYDFGVAETTDILLRYAGENARIWIDGSEIGMHAPHMRFEPEVNLWTGRLAEGNHTMVVMPLLSRIRDMTMFLTDLNGHPLPEEEPTTEEPAGFEALELELRTARAQLANTLEESPLDPEPWRNLLHLQTMTGDAFYGKELALSLPAAFPQSAEAHLQAAVSHDRDSSVPSDLGDQRRDEHLRRALELRQRDPEARLREARMTRDGDPREALAQLDALLVDYPDYIFALLERIDVLRGLGWQEELLQAVEGALAVYPGSRRLQRVALSVFDDIGPRARFLETLEFVATHPATSAGRLVEQAEILAYHRRFVEAERYARAASTDGRGPGVRALHELLLQTAQADAAAQLREEVLSADPEGSGWLWQSELDRAHTDGDEAGFEAALQGLRRLEPTRADTVSAERARENQEAGEPPVDAARAIADFLASPGDTGGYSTVVLRDHRHTELDDEGVLTGWTYRLIRVQDKPGVDAYSSVNPGERELLMLRTIEPGGSSREATDPSGTGTYSLEGLAPGDFVEVWLRRRLPAMRTRPSWNSGAQTLRSRTEPIVEASMSVHLPDGEDLVVTGNLPDELLPQPAMLSTGATELRVDIGPLPPLAREEREAPTLEFLPWFEASWHESWRDPLYRLRRRTTTGIRANTEVRQLADSLRSGDGPVEDLRRVRAWLQREVEPEGSALQKSAAHTLASKTGSPLVLGTSLLRELEVPCELWLVRGHNLPQLEPLPQSRQSNGMVLLRALPDTQDETWIDLGNRYAPLGWMAARARGAPAERLWPAEPARMRTPAGETASLPSVRLSGTLEVAADGVAQGTLELRAFQQADQLLRQQLWQTTPERRTQFIEAFLASHLPSLAVEEFTLVAGAEEADPEAVFTLRVTASSLFRRSGSRLEAPTILTDLLPSMGGGGTSLGEVALGGERQTPMLLPAFEESVELSLRYTGGDLSDVRGWPSVSLDNDWLQLNQSHEVDGNTLQLRRSVRTSLTRLAPQEVAVLQQDLTAYLASMGPGISWEAPGQLAAAP